MRTYVRAALAATLLLLAASPESRAQSIRSDEALIEAAVDAQAIEANGLVRNRIAALRREAAYERHSFFRFRRDLSQVRRLAFYLNPQTKALSPRRDSPRSVRIVAVRSSVTTQGDDGYLWWASLRHHNAQGPWVGEAALYVTREGEVSGTVEVEGEAYLLESAGGGVSMVVEVNERERSRGEEGDAVIVPRTMPSTGGMLEAPSQKASIPGQLMPDAFTQVAPVELSTGTPTGTVPTPSTAVYQRVLVLYTDAVKTLSDANQTKIWTKIQEEVATTNSAYHESAINETRLQLAGVVQLSGYVESGSARDNLFALLPDIRLTALREQYQADLVQVVIASAPGAPGIGVVNATTNSSALSVVTWASLYGVNRTGFTFAHEIGHNQGSEHHPEDPDPSNAQVFAYSFGHRFRDRDCFILCSGYSYYATVMAYTTDPANTANPYVRIARFSNPDVRYDDQPTGVDNTRDNARSIANTAVRMSNLFVNRFSASVSYFAPNAPYADDYTFSAFITGTEPAASYQWFVSPSPSAYGSAVATTQSFTRYLPVGTWYVRLVARSTSGTERTSDIVVSVQQEQEPEPGTCPDPTQLDCPVMLERRSGDDGLAVEALAAAPVLAASPNPSRGESRIVVTLPEAQQVSVGVYDVLGREVYRVAPERRAAGAHVFVLDGASLPSGTYTVRVRHGAAVQTQTLHVVR